MKLTSFFVGCAALLIGVQATSHTKRAQHRELLRKRSKHTSHNLKISGLIKVSGDSCGHVGVGATHEITATSGPNGHIDWLNCNINKSGGWKPPHVTVADLVTVDLNDALKDPNSPFHACSKYLDTFDRVGKKYNIPSILLASFALQESTCNEDAVGGAGEQGLMQLTKENCGKDHIHTCKEVEFNVKTAAKLFSKLLDQSGGNILVAIGNYNGWSLGMTIGKATQAANCHQQNNLDYLQQYVNGWILNRDPRTNKPRLGKYFNLDKCGN